MKKPIPPAPKLVLIRGAGEIGSAAAIFLLRAGHHPVIVEGPAPATTRRSLAFTDAVFNGAATLDGVVGRRVASPEQARELLGREVPILVGSCEVACSRMPPDVLVDARMRKTETADTLRGLAPFVVGLGPGFEAGRHCHFAIETAHGPRLGMVLEAGSPAPYDGVPREIAGTRRERHVLSERAGQFATLRQIGESLAAGDFVGEVCGVPHATRIAGVLFGLVRDGVDVTPGTRLAEVMPEVAPAEAEPPLLPATEVAPSEAVAVSAPVSVLRERPRRIAEAVVEAVARTQSGPAPRRPRKKS